MLKSHLRLECLFHITLLKKSGRTKNKLNKSTTKFQQVTFFSKEILSRATTFMKKSKYHISNLQDIFILSVILYNFACFSSCLPQ